MPRTTPVNPGNRRTRPGRRSTKNSTTSPREIELLERRTAAVELRRKGHTLTQIASEIREKFPSCPAGYDRASAYRDIRLVLNELMQEPAREVLSEELDRLNAAVHAIWDKVESGSLEAIDRLLKIMDQRAKYLGLYSPVQHQLFGADGGPVQVANVTDPDEVYNVAMAALHQAAADYKERQEPRALESAS